MKKALPVFISIAILVLGLGGWWGKDHVTPREAERRRTIESEAGSEGSDGRVGQRISARTGGRTTPGEAPQASGAEERANRRHAVATVGPLPRSRILERAFVSDLGRHARGEAIGIDLPDGRRATGRIERREIDAEGRVVMVEGTLEEPGPGRFLFREETDPGNAWPSSGVVHLFGEEVSYRVEPTGDGAARLVERPVNEVVCRQFALGGVPEADDPVVQEVPADHPTDLPIPGYQNGVVSLQSRPGVTAVLYLDFDGEGRPQEGWGDFDAAPAEDRSTGNVFEIWRRVAEDFAPFNLNVTTDLQVFQRAPANSRQRCIITPTKDASPNAGGVAFVGSFDWGGDTPCWAFASRGKHAAETISHELGHTLDLTHDGRSNPSEEYYSGHGGGEVGWAPIMGTSFDRHLSQWSRGEYANANRGEDDVGMIANNNNTGFRGDDHGGSRDLASRLWILENDSVDDEGVIQTRDDVDVFSFRSTGGNLSLSINPESVGPNLDVLAELYDAANRLVASSNPDGNLHAGIAQRIGGGRYFLHVSGVGRGNPQGDGYSDYASLGTYTIGGTVPGGGVRSTPLVAAGSPVRVLVPSSRGAAQGWTAPGFDDGAWREGFTGVGYDTQGSYDELIALDVESEMNSVNGSVLLRLPFEMANGADGVVRMTLRMKYDDGFVAYLNGSEIARANAPGSPAWNSVATAAHRDNEAIQFVEFDVSASIGELASGTNVLAIHGLNDSVESSDMLVVPELVAVAFPSPPVSILVSDRSPARVLVPAAGGDAPGWTQRVFDDAGWRLGIAGIGYDLIDTYRSLIGIDIEDEMWNRNAGVYIRFPFLMGTSPRLEALTLRMKYDDGFVAYLNGTEVARANAPTRLGWRTPATTSHRDTEAMEFVDFDVSGSLGAIVPGENVLAVHGLNDSADSSDMLIVAQLKAVGDLGPLPPFALLEAGAPARALVPAGAEDAPGWTRSDFDDGSWQQGATGVGYDLVSENSYDEFIGLEVGDRMHDRNGSVYFRVPFYIANPAGLQSLSLRMKYDDGFVAYLNGREVQRRNAPAQPAWNSTATRAHRDSEAVVFEDFDLSSLRSTLVAGENVLAIHGLNDAATSSDLLLLPVLMATGDPGQPDPYDLWAQSYGLTGAQASREADPDRDGVTNFREFVQGGIPTRADAGELGPYPSVEAGPVAGQRVLLLRYRRRLDGETLGLQFHFEVSGDLVTWQLASATELERVPAGDGLSEWVSVRIDEASSDAAVFARGVLTLER